VNTIYKDNPNTIKVFTDTLDQIGSDFRAVVVKTDMQYTKTFTFTSYGETESYTPFYCFRFTEVIEGAENLIIGLINFQELGQWECSIQTYINNEWVTVHKSLLKITEA